MFISVIIKRILVYGLVILAAPLLLLGLRVSASGTRFLARKIPVRARQREHRLARHMVPSS